MGSHISRVRPFPLTNWAWGPNTPEPHGAVLWVGFMLVGIAIWVDLAWMAMAYPVAALRDVWAWVDTPPWRVIRDDDGQLYVLDDRNKTVMKARPWGGSGGYIFDTVSGREVKDEGLARTVTLWVERDVEKAEAEKARLRYEELTAARNNPHREGAGAVSLVKEAP